MFYLTTHSAHFVYGYMASEKELGCHHFARDDDVMNVVDHFLRDQTGAFLHRRDPSAP